MKKYKGLFRCQLGGYAIWLFGAILAAMMFIKFSVVAVILLEVLAFLALGAMIASQVLFDLNKRNLYVPFSFAGHGANVVLVLAGLILEIALAASGQLGLYGLIMFSICAAFYVLIGIFLVKINLKVIDGSIDKSKFER